MGLENYLTSDYIAAANRLKGGRQRIVAYVESYDDVAFWSQILRQRETEKRYFEVMLPSRSSLSKGKKIALSNRLGPHMIACVDADYDWLLQGATPCSQMLCTSPYVLHTYAYAIENLQCYAKGLHEICVKATLNDTHVFPFADFLEEYSTIVWPLFVWNIWAYTGTDYRQFPLSELSRIASIDHIDIKSPHRALENLRRRVARRLTSLQETFGINEEERAATEERLLSLGLTPSTTYLYMRGHDLVDGLILPLLENICRYLRRGREKEIERLAVHERQKQNELSAYHHACSPVDEILRKTTGYWNSEPYQRIMADATRMLP